MVHYLDPKYDLTFKRVFGEHKNLCISLISSMLPLEEGREITSIEYMTGELISEIPSVLRNSIVDVRCTDNFGRQFLVEMQMNWTEEFKLRVLLNASKAYVMQLDISKDWKLLKPVYSINFVNEVFDASPEYYHHYKIVNIKDTEKQIKGLEFVFIELPKFKPQNRAVEKLHELWLRFLTEVNEGLEEAPAELLANEDVREAIEYMKIAAYDKNQLDVYTQMKIDIYTVRSIYYSLKREGLTEGLAEGRTEGLAEGRIKGLAEGRAEGLAEGRTEGLAEGRTEGLAEGRTEGRTEGLAEGRAKGLAEGETKAARNIALNLLKKGLSIEDIAESTGLTPGEIRKLKE